MPHMAEPTLLIVFCIICTIFLNFIACVFCCTMDLKKCYTGYKCCLQILWPFPRSRQTQRLPAVVCHLCEKEVSGASWNNGQHRLACEYGKGDLLDSYNKTEHLCWICRTRKLRMWPPRKGYILFGWVFFNSFIIWTNEAVVYNCNL
jgi:hypothetical protein